MSRQVRRSKQVRADIIEIYGYLHARSPQSAEAVFQAIQQTIAALLEMPGIGRLWESLDPRLSQMRVAMVRSYRNFLIFYRPAATGIEVFRVVHGARELQAIVQEIELDFEDQQNGGDQ